LLLDTHVLLWAAADSARLSAAARALILREENEKIYSAASLWEIAIKSSQGREDFVVDADALRTGLLANGYRELPILGAHVLFTSRLPAIHKDPLDRLLVAQSLVEGLTLMTSDAVVAGYSEAILHV
jgi:PIN domain nuclease of toxin-antitoxin system